MRTPKFFLKPEGGLGRHHQHLQFLKKDPMSDEGGDGKQHHVSVAVQEADKMLHVDSDSDDEQQNQPHHEFSSTNNEQEYKPIPREKLEIDLENPTFDLAHHPHERIGVGYPLGVHLLYLDLTNCRLRKIENLDHLVNLQTLMLRQNLITKVEGLKGLQSLTHLDLYGNQIKRVDSAELNELKNLE